MKTPYKNGKKDGMEERYYDNGQLEVKMFFINGVTSGPEQFIKTLYLEPP